MPKVLKVAAIWSDGENTDIVTRWYTQYAGAAPSSDELNTFCSGVKDLISANLNYAVNEAIELGRVHAIDLSSDVGAEGNWSGTLTGAGTDPANALDVSLVISYEIARRYRGGHPRGYWPLGQATALSTPQRWDPTFLASIQSNIENLFEGVVGLAWTGGGALQHVNVSYFQGFTVVTDPTTGRARNVPNVRGAPVIDAVTSYIARSHIGTQRRRLQY